jgi:hypothetical protein
MNNKSIVSKSETDWARLDAMTDADIDLSDCPEVTSEMFAGAVVRRSVIDTPRPEGTRILGSTIRFAPAGFHQLK